MRCYLCDSATPDEQLHLSLIALIMRSRAELCVIPMQDWLGLDDNARMNIPSTVGGNWRWRLKNSDMSEKSGKMISEMTRIYGRNYLKSDSKKAIIDHERKE